MPVRLPVKVSQLMSPLVNVEKTFEQSLAAAGLPVIPGPMSMSQQLVTSLETSIEQLPAPEELAAAMRLPAPPAPAAAPPTPPAPPAPAAFRPGRRI
jgi:hypothetical protein